MANYQHTLNLPTTILKGVGSMLAEKLAKIGLLTIQDMLFHLPFRYEDRTKLQPIGKLYAFQQAVIEGEIQGCDVVYGKRRSLVCRIEDSSGSICLRFYHFSLQQQRSLAKGFRIRCFGEIRPGASGLEIYHPEYQLLEKGQFKPLEKNLTPCYHTTEGLSQARLRLLLEQAFECVTSEIADLLPSQDTVSLIERLRFLHKPPQQAPIDQLLNGKHPYQQALIKEELTAYQLSLLRLRQQRQQQMAPALHPQPNLIDTFISTLPFELTQAQQRVCAEISQDLAQNQPMLRLLQGDVGSGKTIVAAVCALQASANHKQVALMAPTEILAEQHRINFERWLEPLGIRFAWLSGKQKASIKREQLAAIGSGDAQIVIGTHALFQDNVKFHDLALVIIDEQHRFGVHQRLQLRDKGKKGQVISHQLIMTATPIPRTLAMSAYADLDYSVIDQLPQGRIPVETVAISQNRRIEVIERIRQACLQGRQAYWVCTLIEQSETLSAQAAEETALHLKALLSELNIGLVHGRLKASEKAEAMEAFKNGDTHLLVATTVIEVGVDVPNASLMIIENPERLGLAQLHQLRGRVGRGANISHCVMLYGDKLSKIGKARLNAMRETTDGFRIAEIDLELRGPGEVLGTRQTGDIDFKLANLERDIAILPKIKQQALQLLESDSDICEQLISRWIGNSERFAQA